MAGKFLSRDAIIDTIKSEERTNAKQKRDGLTMHPVYVTSCGCPDPKCGAWHTILMDRLLPTPQQADALLVENSKARKLARIRRRIKPRVHTGRPLKKNPTPLI